MKDDILALIIGVSAAAVLSLVIALSGGPGVLLGPALRPSPPLGAELEPEEELADIEEEEELEAEEAEAPKEKGAAAKGAGPTKK